MHILFFNEYTYPSNEYAYLFKKKTNLDIGAKSILLN